MYFIDLAWSCYGPHGQPGSVPLPTANRFLSTVEPALAFKSLKWLPSLASHAPRLPSGTLLARSWSPPGPHRCASATSRSNEAHRTCSERYMENRHFLPLPTLQPVVVRAAEEGGIDSDKLVKDLTAKARRSIGRESDARTKDLNACSRGVPCHKNC